MKAGTEHHKVSQDGSPMVKALVAMAKFCDAALRSKEEGKGGIGWGHSFVTTFTFFVPHHITGVDVLLDTKVCVCVCVCVCVACVFWVWLYVCECVVFVCCLSVFECKVLCVCVCVCVCV